MEGAESTQGLGGWRLGALAAQAQGAEGRGHLSGRWVEAGLCRILLPKVWS